MLYLAQVKKGDLDGEISLKLLACQKAEYTWAVTNEGEVAAPNSDGYQDGALVLVETAAGQVKSIQDATGWILELVEQYLSNGISPALLQEEVQRAEQWRQSLTLQSQELGRRALEMEARLDQIQELEESLKREKKQLELMAAELKALDPEPEEKINT